MLLQILMCVFLNKIKAIIVLLCVCACHVLSKVISRNTFIMVSKFKHLGINGLNNPQGPSEYKNQLSFIGLTQDLGYPNFTI